MGKCGGARAWTRARVWSVRGNKRMREREISGERREEHLGDFLRVVPVLLPRHGEARRSSGSSWPCLRSLQATRGRRPGDLVENPLLVLFSFYLAPFYLFFSVFFIYFKNWFEFELAFEFRKDIKGYGWIPLFKGNLSMSFACSSENISCSFWIKAIWCLLRYFVKTK